MGGGKIFFNLVFAEKSKRTPKMFIVKMEGFAGFVGLMFGLVVLSVIITLVVCAVKRHRREWLQDGQRRV